MDERELRCVISDLQDECREKADQIKILADLAQQDKDSINASNQRIEELETELKIRGRMWTPNEVLAFTQQIKQLEGELFAFKEENAYLLDKQITAQSAITTLQSLVPTLDGTCDVCGSAPVATTIYLCGSCTESAGNVATQALEAHGGVNFREEKQQCGCFVCAVAKRYTRVI